LPAAKGDLKAVSYVPVEPHARPKPIPERLVSGAEREPAMIQVDGEKIRLVLRWKVYPNLASKMVVADNAARESFMKSLNGVWGFRSLSPQFRFNSSP
jgi:hypothetical protein